MAMICYGPPPLPPNKKSLLTFSNNRHNKYKQTLLSSTYHSFRDPLEENEIVAVTCEDIDFMNGSKPNGGIVNNGSTRRLVHTNSLSRCKGAPKVSLVRSHSDGNLDKKGLFAPVTINKYIKVLSGSWKNLLNCKFTITFLYFFSERTCTNRA